MKKGNIKRAIFTVFFVAIIVSVRIYTMPDMNVVGSASISGLAAFIGYIICSKLFQNK